MKKYQIIPIMLLLSSFLFSCSCHNNSEPNPIDPDLIVIVRFYIDYNHQNTTEDIYYSCQVQNGFLITAKPADPPQSYYPEFPNFKGWSEKEIIDNYNDLWNFDSDVMASTMQVLRMYGIWMAPGE